MMSGVWNRRYYRMASRQVVESAQERSPARQPRSPSPSIAQPAAVPRGSRFPRQRSADGPATPLTGNVRDGAAQPAAAGRSCRPAGGRRCSEISVCRPGRPGGPVKADLEVSAYTPRRPAAAAGLLYSQVACAAAAAPPANITKRRGVGLEAQRPAAAPASRLTTVAGWRPGPAR